jgi:hypothetical protein
MCLFFNFLLPLKMGYMRAEHFWDLRSLKWEFLTDIWSQPIFSVINGEVDCVIV